MGEINLGTVYDINKNMMKYEKPLDPILFNKKCEEVGKWISNRMYSMLLCKEIADFTVFTSPCHIEGAYPCEIKNAVKLFKETLQNRGDILAIDQLEDGNYEIWIRRIDGDFCYYFFDYEFGVVDIGEGAYCE